MKKPQLIDLVNTKYDALHEWISVHDDAKFEYTSRSGKWTTGQHIDHLILTASPINKIFRAPKFLLKWRFGVNNRTERTYEETYTRYVDTLKAKGIKAPKQFSPAIIMNADKAQKIHELRCQGKTLVKQLNKHSEKQLSRYIIPHPVIGYITLRELVYFTAFHTEHHHNILKEYHT